MNIKMIKLFSFLFLSLSFFLVSCEKETLSSDEVVENYVDDAVYNVQKDCNAGRHGCFEFIFPISVETEDGTIITADDYQSLKEQIRAWKEDNPDATQRPTLVFPLELITEGGIIITVSSKQHLRTVIKICRRIHWNNNSDRPMYCFKLQFPLTIEFPNTDSQEVNNRMELKQAVRAWKEANPDIDERPSLQFPVTVEMEDGTLVEVQSKEELQALKDDCID